jgi:signal transduction histidine kinase/CheY-like chemotaxis protein/streptogramin lyase
MLLLVIFILAAVPAPAQHYYFKTFTREEGLGESVVNTIFQDKKGFLWIGTYGGGVDRYDGLHFTNYSTKNGLCDNSVFKILGDHQGNLWFATFNGLSKYDGHSFTTYTVKDGLSSNYLRTLCLDQRGNLWLATESDGVNRFDGRHFTRFTTEKGLTSNDVYSLFADRHGNLWLGTGKGVDKYDGKRFSADAITRRLNGYCVQTVLEDERGDLWFGTKSDGAFRYDSKKMTFTRYTSREGLCSNDILHIMADSEGKLWFSTPEGVSVLREGHFTVYTTKQGLNQNRTDFTLEDREGNVWFATIHGLVRFRGENFAFFNEKTGLENNAVLSFWEDTRKDLIWLGTRSGIATYHRKNAAVAMSSDFNSRQHTGAFHEDRSGNLWFRSGGDIFLYDGTYTNFSKKIGLEPLKVSCILDDRFGNLWFATLYNGVKVWDGKTIKSYSKENKLPHNRVNVLKEDEEGKIWLGTAKGLVRYDGRNFTRIDPGQGVVSGQIMSIVEDQDHYLWIGTYGEGVTRYKPGHTVTFTSQGGLLDDQILSMVFDREKNLWLASKNGLTVLAAAEFNKTGRREFRYYTREDGFIGIEPNDNAVYRDKEGNLWFGTMKGAIRFNPQQDKPNKVESATYITGMKLFFERVDWAAYGKGDLNEFGLPIGLELPPARNHLTFEFVGICLTAPGKVRYQVMLEGFDNHWSPVTAAAYATYSNLPPGEYAFRVKSCNNEGLWNKEPAVYRFRIMSPFWQTWWFYVLAFTFVVFSLYGVVKLRTYTLKKQKKTLQEQVRLHTRELAQINRELEQRVEERTRKLLIANEKLIHAQKMEAIGMLAGGVAHDLNNILAGIINYPELLLMELPEDSPIRSTVLSIQRSGLKAAAVVQDMLTLARRGVTVTEVVSLNQVIADFLQSPECRKILEDNPGVRIETQLDKELLNIIGSPLHLSKTLMNLTANAVEAMPQGGTAVITTVNRYLDSPDSITGYNQVKEGDYTILKVSDTGVGMSETDMKRVFEPFYTKKKMGKSGTGLGMAVVWGTVQDHNGYITVQRNEVEKGGTTFTLYFPATWLSLVVGEPGLTINELMGNGESILVVDDIEEQREVATMILEKLKYTVHAVRSGEEAIAFLKKQPVDLLMLDMIMDPGISGLETYKQVLQMYPQQKTILVSGYAESDEVKTAQHLGAGFYVKKPYNLEKIGLAIKNELSRIW